MEMIIGGKRVGFDGREECRITNPATREMVDTVPVATRQDVEDCLDNAQRGKREWGGMPLYARTAILRKCSETLIAHKTELATLLAREMGKPVFQGEIDVEDAAHKYMSHAERANHLYGEVMSDMQPGVEKTSSSQGENRWGSSCASCRSTTPSSSPPRR
ncbi:MAG: aldehyde dehydrogenase family protein [Bacillota bacterium]